MLKNCYFCKKLVRTIRIYPSQSPTVSNRKNKVRIVGVRFKESSLITNRRRFTNDKIPTRVICKLCKSKDKKEKPLDYLVKALSNTISKSYDIETDTAFCTNDNLAIHNDIDNDELITERDDVVTFNEENPYDLMTEDETQFWGGAVHTLDNIAVQQGILRELYDSAPNDIVHQPELLRDFFENVPEQLAERQQLMRGRDENILELFADQQRLLRGVEEPIADEQRFLQEGDVPQQLAVQHGLGAGGIRQPEQIEALRRLIPHGENHVIGQIAMQQRFRVGNENPPGLNVLQQRRGVGDINLPGHMILQQRDLFRASANVSKQLVIHLGIRIGSGNVPDSFAVHQKIFSEDDNIPDMFNVHRTLLQEDDDHVQESDENSQEPILDIAYFQEDDSDVLDLLTVWQRLSLNETLPCLISTEYQVLPNSENNAIHQGLLQEVENNVPNKYVTSQNSTADISGQEEQIEINYELRSKDDDNDVSDQLAIDQELLHKDIAQKPFAEQQKPLCQTYGSDDDTQEPIDVQQKTLCEGDYNTPVLAGQIRLSADNGNQQEQTAMHQKIPPDYDYSINNKISGYQEFLQESKEEVQEDNLYSQGFLRESDNNTLQEVMRLSAGDCDLQHIALNLQVPSGNNNNDRVGVQQEIQQVDDDKMKERIDNQSESLRKFRSNTLESSAVQEIMADDNNQSKQNEICQKFKPDENFPSQVGVQSIEDRQKSFLGGDNNALKLAGQLKLNADDSNIYEDIAMHQKSQSNNDNSSSDKVTAHQELPKEGYYKKHETMAEQQSPMGADNNNYQFVDSMQNDIHKERVKQHVAGNIPSTDVEFVDKVDKGEQIKGSESILRVGIENVSNENNDKIVDVLSEQITILGKRAKEIKEESAKVRKMSLKDSIATRRGEESLL